MPRKRELTWQAGNNGRSGRWRKKYRGAVYYFPGGNGKTDREAYIKALEQWKQQRAEIDAQIAKPYEEDYQAAITEWVAVLNWSNQHGDQEYVALARHKVRELESRLTGSNPRPLTHGDRLNDAFEFDPDVLEEIVAIVRSHDFSIDDLELLPGIPSTVIPDAAIADEIGMTPRRLAGRIWRDRVESQLKLAEVNRAATVDGNVERFKSHKRSQVAAKEISAGRYANLVRHLDALCDFVGRESPVAAINERLMTDFRSDLITRVASGEFGRSYAKDQLNSVKQFVRWLWRERTLEDLPRVIDDRQFNIRASKSEIKTFTKPEVCQLLGAAYGQVRLHILLALNAALTQKDISDLKPTEVNWKEGTIRRKRSKTNDGENVPVVTYLLWPETFRWLQEYRSTDGDRVLLTANGGPLKVERLRPDGRLHKVDNIERNFGRLCRRVKITGRSFTCLKKTSATLLRGNERFSGIESYFLGHAPRTMSDKHYAGGPDALLAEALKWLADEYEIGVSA